MSSRHYEVAGEIKAKDRRIETLKLHLAHVDIKNQYRAVWNKYVQIKNPKERDAYYAKHEKEIETFKQSRDYTKAVLNGKVDVPPVKDWKSNS